MLLTTSRKPSAATRRLAKSLALCFPFSKYSSRGKSSMLGFVHAAGLAGHSRLAVINDSKGNPSQISFARIIPEKTGYGFEWIEKIIVIKSCKLGQPPKKQAKTISMEGSASGEFSVLFGIEPDEFRDAAKAQSVALCLANALKISCSGTTAVELSVELYDKKPAI